MGPHFPLHDKPELPQPVTPTLYKLKITDNCRFFTFIQFPGISHSARQFSSSSSRRRSVADNTTFLPRRRSAPRSSVMASNEESEENSSRGNEWEVVSLTASTYAAAPGPREAESKEDEKVDTYGVDEAETSRALFLSRHFLFPPTQDENLLLERDAGEIDSEQGKDVSSNLDTSQGGKSSVEDDTDHAYEGLNVQDELSVLEFFSGKNNKSSIPGADFDESQIVQKSDLVDKEQNPFDTTKYGPFHSESDFGESMTMDESMNILEQLDPSADISEAPRIDDSGFPRGAWWKRRASSMYAHAKEANAVWSIFIAAAVMGLVILGKRWQQERWQTLQLKWHIGPNDQKMSRMVGQMTGLKDMIAVGQRRGSFIMSSSSN